MNGKHTSRASLRTAGFSLIEIVIVIAIAFIIAAVAIPQALGAYRTYQLNNAASEVAGILKFTRMEAIRQNKSVWCRGQAAAGGGTQIWTDEPTPAAPNGNGAPDPTEKQILLGPSGDTVAMGSVPNIAAIAGQLGVAAFTDATTSNGIQFDQRGAVNPVGVFYIVCIQNTAVPTAGYRAVILMPSGAVQTWSADNAGNWTQTS